MKGYSVISFAALVFVAGCSGGDKLKGDWIREGSTQQSACALTFEGATWAHNCNGRNVIRGEWTVDGTTIRFLGSNLGPFSCDYTFNGSFLVLDRCDYRGRWQPASDWFKDN